MPASMNVEVKTLFSPWDDTDGAFEAFLGRTKRSLYFVIYGWHLPKMTDALIQMVKSGYQVGGILDHSQERGKAEQQEVERAIAAGVPLLVGTSPVHGQILHSKFAIRDQLEVEYGSWNYSLSASQQSNTMSFVHGAEYAKGFLFHYHRLHAFIVLHQMAMQPAGELTAPDVPHIADMPTMSIDAQPHPLSRGAA